MRQGTLSISFLINFPELQQCLAYSGAKLLSFEGYRISMASSILREFPLKMQTEERGNTEAYHKHRSISYIILNSKQQKMVV